VSDGAETPPRLSRSSLVIMNDAGELLPARLELSESSGPVSPRYQYTTRVVITVEPPATAPLLAIEHVADYVGGVPAFEVHTSEPLSKDRYEQLWADLLAQDVFALGGDLASAKRDRTGVSFNHVEIVLGDPGQGGSRVRFDYLLPQLQDPANARHLAVVESLKSLIPKAPANAAPS
jgi:hypothetical protein